MDKAELEAILNQPLTQGSSANSYRLPDGWKFSDSFPSLANTFLGEAVFTAPEFRVEENNDNTLPADFQEMFGHPLSVEIAANEITGGLSFSGSLRLEAGHSLSSLLPPAEYLLEGPVEIINQIPRLWLKSAADVAVSLAGFESTANLQLVSLLAEASSGDAVTHTALNFLRLETALIKDELIVPISGVFANMDPHLVMLDADAESLSKIGFNEIATLFEQIPLASFFSPAFSFLDKLYIPDLSLSYSLARASVTGLMIGIAYDERWTVLEDPSISFYGMGGSIDITDPFDGSNMSFSLRLFGDAEFTGFTVRAFLDPSNVAFEVTSLKDQQLDLTALIQSILSNEIGLPQIVCTELILGGGLQASYYTIGSALEGDWDILGNQQLFIKEIRFSFTHTFAEPSGTAGYLSGIFSIAGVDISISAEHNPEPNSGWQFEGSTLNGEIIPVGQLIEDIKNLFGLGDLSLPSALTDLVIDKLAVSFNTESKDFFFSCELLDGTQPLFTLTIALTSKPTNYDYKFQIIIGKLQFDLHFNQTVSSTAYVATYREAKSQAMRVKDIVEPISTELADIIPEALEIDLKDVLFAYSKTSTESKFLFGIDIATGINLSNLPLVGKEFSPDQTVGVDDLQIVVTSKPFDQQTVGTINSLMPQGVTRLPVQGLDQGLYVSAKMNFGSSSTPLGLPVAGAAASAQPPSQTSTTPNTSATVANDGAQWFTLQKAFGPVNFKRVGVQYAEADDEPTIWFLLDAALSFAGLTLSMDGLGLGSSIKGFSPKFDLRGIGISYQASAVEIAGAFLRKQVVVDGEQVDEYDGAVILKAEDLKLSAIGSYSYVDDHPSLFIYAVLDYPLGGPAFFFVTGLAAGFGYNRSLIIPPIEHVAQFPLVKLATQQSQAASSTATTGASTLSPQASPPTTNDLMSVLNSLQPYIPPEVGEIFLAAGIRFTSFKIIDSFALLIVAFGEKFEVNLLGISTLIAPTPEAGQVVTPLAEIQMVLRATYNPDEGLLAVSGQLTSASYILSRNCHLTGGFAFYSWFAPNLITGEDHTGDFVQTLGGYHPNFDVPAHYPQVPRLGFNWKVSSRLNIKGDAYYALTSSALMAGGHLQATWVDGSLKAWFNAGADFLIAWKPYHYEAKISVDMGVSYTYELFGTHHLNVDVGASLKIWGPDFSGKAHVDLSIVSFTVEFGSDSNKKPGPINWPTFKESFLPGSNAICSISVKEGLINSPPDSQSEQTGDEFDWVLNPKELCLIANSVIPAKTALKGAGQTSIEGVTSNETEFGVAPMGLSSSAFTSVLRITITREGDPVEGEFDFSPILKNVPAGLWGQSASPSLGGERFIVGALTGFEIKPKGQSVAGASKPIPAANLQIEGDTISDAFKWGSPGRFTEVSATEQERITMIDETIESDAVRAARDQILNALGVTAEIDLEGMSAEKFLFAPQVGALAG
jgi:uncharacterized protein DUF6603